MPPRIIGEGMNDSGLRWHTTITPLPVSTASIQICAPSCSLNLCTDLLLCVLYREVGRESLNVCALHRTAHTPVVTALPNVAFIPLRGWRRKGLLFKLFLFSSDFHFKGISDWPICAL